MSMGDEEDQAAGAAHTIIVQNRQLRTLPFHPEEGDQLGAAQAWEAWIEGIEREFRFFRITEDQDKVDPRQHSQLGPMWVLARHDGFSWARATGGHSEWAPLGPSPVT